MAPVREANGGTNGETYQFYTDLDAPNRMDDHFNAKSKTYIGLFDEAKNETRHPIDSLDEIYDHAAAIRETVRLFA